MISREPVTPLEYLAECSRLSLREFQFNNLDRSCALKKQILELLEEWADTQAKSMLAEVLLSMRARMAQLALPFPQEGADVPQRVQTRRARVFDAANRRHRNEKTRNFEDVA